MGTSEMERGCSPPETALGRVVLRIGGEHDQEKPVLLAKAKRGTLNTG